MNRPAVSLRAALSSAAPCLFALLLGVGCATEAVDEPEDVPRADPYACDADAGLELQMISNFESGTARNFYTNDDRTEGASVSPPAGSSSPSTEAIEGGRCGVSEMAFHMTGSNLSDWGMVFGTNFADGPLDRSEWDGISFWARRGSESGTSLFFSVTDTKTDPIDGYCDAEPEFPEEKCDAYGAGIGLAEEWRFFAIPFSDLRQRGFGVITEELLLGDVVGLGWAAEGSDWDVWVDDVAFYSAP